MPRTGGCGVRFHHFTLARRSVSAPLVPGEPFTTPGVSHAVGASKQELSPLQDWSPSRPTVPIGRCRRHQPPRSRPLPWTCGRSRAGRPPFLCLWALAPRCPSELSRSSWRFGCGRRQRTVRLHGVSHPVGLSAAAVATLKLRVISPACRGFLIRSALVHRSFRHSSTVSFTQRPTVPIGRCWPQQPPGPWPLPRTGGRNVAAPYSILSCRQGGRAGATRPPVLLYTYCTQIGHRLDTPRPAYPRLHVIRSQCSVSQAFISLQLAYFWRLSESATAFIDLIRCCHVYLRTWILLLYSVFIT